MTAETAAFPCYGAIPFRALRDKRLAGIPLAVLGILAAHDRFGRNGQGCTASQGRLAELVGCHRQTINEAIVLLDQLGYITCTLHGRAQRRSGYSVVYDNEADNEAFKPDARRGPRKLTACRPQPTSSQSACRPQRTSTKPACPPQQTSERPGNRPQPVEISASEASPPEAEYILRSSNRYRRSSDSSMCNSGLDPGRTIDTEPDPTAQPCSLKVANQRLLERHGRPDLTSTLGRRAHG